jgi:peptidoglycan/xylan/chitin deacetylase (PgdA/CDA1 family)
MDFKTLLYESYHRPRRILANVFDTPAVILLYHRVTQISSDPQNIAVEPEKFYQQIQYLRNNCTLLTAHEFVDLFLNHRRFPKHSVLLTFDDGYADNVLEALPILESLNAQAIFYITTSLLDSEKELWWDDLERIFLLETNLPDGLEIEIKGVVHRFDTSSMTYRNEAYRRLHRLIKYVTASERENIFTTLYSWSTLSSDGRPSHRMMSTAELLRLSKSSSAVIGAHTHTHTALVNLSYDEQKKDIQQAQQILTKTLNYSPEHFSYPFGLKKDYTADTLQIVREMNYKIVCSNYYDQVHRWSPRFELPRILVRNWDISFFQRSIQQFFRY